MVGQKKRPLKVFLCHASGDKPAVRQLYKRLVMEGVDAWLDQEKLLPGQDWRLEIPKAVREADVVVICLSNRSITKEGYIQKEIRFALDIAEEKPEGTIFVIPARLEDCPVPERLNRWQWVDLFDDNGSVKLLRSLRMRADMAGAVIEPLPYEDKEFEQRIEQLYTEGLAAFWVEDWDKACHRFQTILSERSNHAGASEKLEEAERQRNLKKLYSKAVEAQNNQNWQLVISTLEDLLKKDSAYKDAGAMLKTAMEEQQLKALYAEAKTLHAAQKWEAVIKVFEQISSLEKNFLDPDGLLASAQKEVAELQRLARLNELYSNAIHKMDSGEWYEARNLLEQVHKTRTGFSETEKLLSKVETEIRQSEDEKKRQDQINTLYEQAHGLLRSKKWRKALDKIEEIRILDEKFEDPEKIAERAQKELAREEQEAERQNELSAMYAEAVRLVREEKYQDALEKWHEIRGIDSKYPDRQKVQRTARKSLAALAKPVTVKRRIVLPKSLWIGAGGIVIIGVIILGLVLSGNIGEGLTLPSSSVPTSVSGGKTVAPSATRTPVEVSSTSRPTATQATSGYDDPTMYDEFDNPSDDGYNRTLWSPLWSGNCATVVNTSGKLSFTVYDTRQCRIVANGHKDIPFTEPFFFEAQLFLAPATTSEFTHLLMSIQATNKITGDGFGSICGLFGNNDTAKQDIECWSGFSVNREDPEHNLRSLSPEWHTIRIEVYPPTKVLYIVDEMVMDEYIISQPDQFDSLLFSFNIGMNMEGSSATGYFDNVRIGLIEDDPNTFFDDFDGPSLDSLYQRYLPEVSNYRYDAQEAFANYKGVSEYSFETIDESSVIRLNNQLGDASRKGWLINKTFTATAFELEVRFNTLVQSSKTGIDQMIELWLLDVKDITKYDRASVLSWNYGEFRHFSAESTISKRGNILSFNFANNTWYRLIISGTAEKESTASIYNDDKSIRLATIPLEHTIVSFPSGFKIGISQSMGGPGGTYPTDVAIDWIRITVSSMP